MSQQQSPWLEGAYGWNFGEGGWNTGMDQNLLKFSFMFDRNVDGVVGSLPSAVNGQAYFLTVDNRLYFAVGTTWYSTPVPKWFEFKDRSTGATYQYNGVSAAQVNSPAQLDSRLDAIELTVGSLGTAAFEDISFFATQSALDIVEAGSQGYTDTLRSDLSDTITLTKGSALIGRGGQVVNSIAILRSLSKTATSKNALVTGYYAAGDGGGGTYWLDVADTTSADNGGTVIVASDGGRWKLVHSGCVSIRQFGARGSGAAGDNVFVQNAINAWTADSRIGAIYCPAGNYVFSARVNIPKLTKGLTFYGDGKATSFRGGEGFGGELFLIGSDDPTAGVAYEFKDFIMAAPLSGTSNGIYCKNANVIRFRGVTGQNLVTAFNLESCFAVTFKECLFDVVDVYAIYSSTPCHNLIIDNCKFFTVGGTAGFALQIDVATDNIVIQNSDFEFCRAVYSLNGASAVVLSGNYIEYCTAPEFVHTGAAVRGWSCVSNWIALHQGAATPWDNILDGEFKLNTLFNITASWGTSVQNVDVGLNTIRSGASLATTPFKTVTGYNNSWVAGTRTPSYHKSADGTVYLRGEITGGSLGNLAFNLPAGFRPSQQMRFAVGAGANSTTFGMVVVDSNGNVVPQVGSPMSLDGISFKAVTV